MIQSSCEIVALRKNFVDRPESYDSASAKNCTFLAHEKTRMVWGIFLYSHTQPVPKQGIKIFLTHFTTTLSNIVQSSLASPTLEFFAIICHNRHIDVYSHVVKGSQNV